MHNHWMVVKVFVSKECRYVSFICFCKQYQFNSSFFVQLFGVSISEKKVKQINNNVFAERFAVHTLKKIDLAWMKYEKRNYLVCIYCAVIKFLLCTNSFDSATQWVDIFSETAFFLWCTLVNIYFLQNIRWEFVRSSERFEWFLTWKIHFQSQMTTSQWMDSQITVVSF